MTQDDVWGLFDPGIDEFAFPPNGTIDPVEASDKIGSLRVLRSMHEPIFS